MVRRGYARRTARRTARHANDDDRTRTMVRLHELPHDLSAVTRARHSAGRTLRGLGLDDETVDDAELVVSELVANAVYHAGGVTAVVVEPRRDGGVKVSVYDDSTIVPQVTTTDPHAATGRGLLLVECTTTRWGTELLPGGKRVWAEIAPNAGRSRSDEVAG